MAVKKISIDQFIQLAVTSPIFDVRSPGEYNHAHIPGACSLPLFTDEERKITGTLYKQESREKAIKKGLEFFGPKMVSMVEKAESVINEESKTVLVHCWRGGMRSAGVAWLLDLYGFNVYTLAGGYKAYRHWVLDLFAQEYPFKIIGGNTGSGKTAILHQFKKNGIKIIDLEGLANHKGSAFGAINMPVQPSQEMFENLLAAELYKNSSLPDTNTASTYTIYMEDESQRIGLVNIPTSLWAQMRRKPLIFLQIPFEERLQYIVKDYGSGDKEKLVNAVMRIKKRLGGLQTKMAINHLLEDNITEAFRVLLAYYDKYYNKSLQSREGLEMLYYEMKFDIIDTAAIAAKLLLLKTQQINA